MIGNGPVGFGRGASEKDQTLGTSPASYLTASIGYVTPDDEHHGRGPAIRRARTAGMRRAHLTSLSEDVAKQLGTAR